MLKTIALIGALAAAAPAQATVFSEIEPNNSTETAQVLVHDGSILVTGFREAITENTYTDFFRFDATAGDQITMLSTVTGGGGDTVMRLLDAAGNVLAEDDDGAGFPNARIVFDITTTGNYFAALRGFGNSTYDYQLSITGLTPSAAVPEPATWALLIGGFGLAGTAARRSRRATLRFA